MSKSACDVIAAAVRRGAQMTLREVRTGDVHEVRERIGSRQGKPGTMSPVRLRRALALT